MQECLDATRADDFDSGDNGPITWRPVRHVDALNPRQEVDRKSGMAVRFERRF
jgi:hypothetical protein